MQQGSHCVGLAATERRHEFQDGRATLAGQAFQNFIKEGFQPHRHVRRAEEGVRVSVHRRDRARPVGQQAEVQGEDVRLRILFQHVGMQMHRLDPRFLPS